MLKKSLQRFRKITAKDNNHYGKNVSMGENVNLGGNVYMFKTAPITIGDHTMIAYNVTIHTSTHDYTNHPMWKTRIDRPVSIGKHVWIGTNAIILPGVIIEDYAVVGAGSVVTAHVPKGAIVAGNPARIIKFRDLDMIKREEKEFSQIWEKSKEPNWKAVKESFLDKDKTCKGVNKE